MLNSRYKKIDKRTSQGGNLSLVLSNIMFSELDNQLNKCDLRFVRYVDDCVIIVRSKAGLNEISCFEVILNCCMPNGIYSDVRKREKSPKTQLLEIVTTIFRL